VLSAADLDGARRVTGVVTVDEDAVAAGFWRGDQVAVEGDVER
jgi:hypothetical protein